MLVLDANILIRAVLGRRVRDLLTTYGTQVDFFTPDVALDEAREHLPGLLQRRNVPVAPAMEYLASVAELAQEVESETYTAFDPLLGNAWPAVI